MMHNTHVTGPDGADTGCWGVGRTGAPHNRVLVQVLSYATRTQTRVSLAPAQAIRLAADLADCATGIGEGLTVEWGSNDETWLATSMAGDGRVLLALHDEDGANGDRRTELALPVPDVLQVIDELTAWAREMLANRCAVVAAAAG
jgi:hypothetical protein